MKKLKEYGVQELNAQEMREIEGGSIWESLFILLFIVAAIFAPNN